MPYESDSQRRFMHAKHPEIAKRWDKHTPKGKKLPEHKKEAMAKVAAAMSKLSPDTREKLAHRLHEYLSRPSAQAVVHTKLAAYMSKSGLEKEAFMGALAAGAAKWAPKIMGGVKNWFSRTPMHSDLATKAVQGGTIPAVNFGSDVAKMSLAQAPWMMLPYVLPGGGGGQQQ